MAMADELQIDTRSLRLTKGDITALPIEAFVYYARHDLALGSGYGTAIAVRGGPEVQKEVTPLGPLETTQVAVSGAGEMEAKKIIHAVGPRFQEEDLETKLETTVRNCLKAAEEAGIKEVAFPAMGAGFYGVPLEVSARITLDTIRQHLAGDTTIDNVVVCLMDNREYQPFQKQLASMAQH
jgi:O-acetyl-ADP-ribose deacetylase (regulator of RNase III)